MKKFFFQILGLLIIIFGALFYTYNQGALTGGGDIPVSSGMPGGTKILRLLDASSNEERKIVKAEIFVEVADTKEKRSLGLGNRESLATNSGMLFIFERTTKPTFWMKGLKFPLDFIWVNNDLVVDLLKNVPPPAFNTADEALPLYAPSAEIEKVLEVNAGFIAKNDIRVGDKIEVVDLE